MAKADVESQARASGVWNASAEKRSEKKSWLARLPDDGTIMRGAFFLMLAAIAIGLFYDYRQMTIVQAESELFRPSPSSPVLPSYSPASPDDDAPGRDAPEVTSDPDDLRSALSVQLISGGVLQVTGTIDPGSAVRFGEEIARVSEYVDLVDLNSPGGSVNDALEIARLIREKDLNTKVDSGALCASACPLIFAAGVERFASSASAIGVHQVFSGPREGPRNADLEISGTQRLTASINRHLEEMGVNPDLWLHALETPPDRLYYFTSDELTEYRLATEISATDS